MNSAPHNTIHSKSDSRGKAFLTIAVICGIAFLSSWATGLVVYPPSNWPMRYRFLGLSFVLSMGGTIFGRHVARHQMVAQRFFESLSQIDPAKLAQGTLASDLPTIAPESPWHATAQRFTAIFREQCERVEQVEHQRSSLEVRIQRNAGRHAQIDSIFATLPEAVIAVDQHDQLILANPAAERLLGIDLTACENRAITHILHCERLVELLSETRRRKAATRRSIEVELTDAEGQSHWYGVTARSFSKLEGHALDAQPSAGVFAVLRDISLLKASHKRNAEFVSAVSHEMKTPLAGIKAYVELLVDGDADDEQTREEFLNVINGQANRLQRLIDNLLNLARIEAGVVQVSKEATSLNELLQEAFDLSVPRGRGKADSIDDRFEPVVHRGARGSRHAHAGRH